MHKVTFKFENSEDVTVFAAFGESLLEVARKTNVAIDAPCSGNGILRKMPGQAGERRTWIHRKHAIFQTKNMRKDGDWPVSARYCDDVAVLVPDIASAYKSRMKVADLSSAEEVKIFEDLKNQISEVGIELENNLGNRRTCRWMSRSLDDTMPDNERLTRALQAATGMEKIRIPYLVSEKAGTHARRQ